MIGVKLFANMDVIAVIAKEIRLNMGAVLNIKQATKMLHSGIKQSRFGQIKLMTNGFRPHPLSQ